jgi:hypothetical protein
MHYYAMANHIYSFQNWGRIWVFMEEDTSIMSLEKKIYNTQRMGFTSFLFMFSKDEEDGRII